VNDATFSLSAGVSSRVDAGLSHGDPEHPLSHESAPNGYFDCQEVDMNAPASSGYFSFIDKPVTSTAVSLGAAEEPLA
jgi:hypothetical protein